MSGPWLWATIAAMAVVTYALRATFLLLHERVTFPPLVKRALRYVPYAVLAALLLPAVLVAGPTDDAAGFPRLIAALAAGLIAWRTRSVLLTLVLGMGTLWFVQWLL